MSHKLSIHAVILLDNDAVAQLALKLRHNRVNGFIGREFVALNALNAEVVRL